MTRSVEHYLQARAAMVALVTPLDAAGLAQRCQACPAWSIQDVVAHHVHTAIAYLSGRFPASAFSAITAADVAERTAAAAQRDAWTERGVLERRGRTLAQLLAEWDAAVARMDDQHAAIGLDLLVHVDDVAETLGAAPPPAPRDDAMDLWYRAFVVPRLATIGASVDLVGTDSGGRWSRGGAGASVVAGAAYDLLRVVSGRRTRAEADAVLQWCDTPEPVRVMLPVYGWPG